MTVPLLVPTHAPSVAEPTGIWPAGKDELADTIPSSSPPFGFFDRGLTRVGGEGESTAAGLVRFFARPGVVRTVDGLRLLLAGRGVVGTVALPLLLAERGVVGAGALPLLLAWGQSLGTGALPLLLAWGVAVGTGALRFVPGGDGVLSVGGDAVDSSALSVRFIGLGTLRARATGLLRAAMASGWTFAGFGGRTMSYLGTNGRVYASRLCGSGVGREARYCSQDTFGFATTIAFSLSYLALFTARIWAVSASRLRRISSYALS